MMSELSAGPPVADGRKRDWDEDAGFVDPFVVATSPEDGMDPPLPEHADSNDKAASVASAPPRRQRIRELI